MKPSIVALLGSLLLAIPAGLRAQTAPVPLHPTNVTASVEGSMAMVFSVDRKNIVVMRSGFTERVSLNAALGLRRGITYHRTGVQLADLRGVSRGLKPISVGAGATADRAETIDVAASVTAARTVDGVFGAIVVFDSRDVNGGNVVAPLVKIFEVGRLEAGVPKTLRESVQIGSAVDAFVMLHLFAEGLELRTPEAEAMSEVYRQIEVARLQNAIAERVKKGLPVTAPPEPFVRIPPMLSDEERTEAPPQVAVTVRINEAGRVDNVKLPDGLKPAVADAVRSAVSGWLFVPAVKGGVFVPRSAQIPILLGSSE